MPSKQEAEQFKCTVCAKGFYLKSSVSAHMELVHGNNPFKCSICNKGIIFWDHFLLLSQILNHTENLTLPVVTLSSPWSYP